MSFFYDKLMERLGLGGYGSPRDPSSPDFLQPSASYAGGALPVPLAPSMPTAMVPLGGGRMPPTRLFAGQAPDPNLQGDIGAAATPGINPMAGADAPMPSINIPRSGLGGVADRFQNFTDTLGSGMFPIDPTVAKNMTPEQIQGMQRQGLLRAGLGIMAARGQGASNGGAIGTGILGAMDSTDKKALQQFEVANKEADTAKEDQRYTQNRQDVLDQQATVNDREKQELTGKLALWKGEIDNGKLAAQRYGMANPAETQRLAYEEKKYQRALDLVRKPTLTVGEKYELDMLTGGSVSRIDKADPFAGAGGAAGADPKARLIADPRL